MECTNSWISITWWRKLEKTLQKYLEKGDFWPDLHKIWCLPWQFQKWWTCNWQIKISTENEKQLQIFSHLRVNRLFFCGVRVTSTPLVHPRVKTGHSTPLHNKPTCLPAAFLQKDFTTLIYNIWLLHHEATSYLKVALVTRQIRNFPLIKRKYSVFSNNYHYSTAQK